GEQAPEAAPEPAGDPAPAPRPGIALEGVAWSKGRLAAKNAAEGTPEAYLLGELNRAFGARR
ncbi:MAG: hypothetical protein HUK26_03225, partial [Duodenibacillus sp.]|nr:hypothetical protein [Duodenibacillus sp.]